MRKKGNHQKLRQACCVTEKDRKMKSTTIQEGARGKDSRGKAFSQVQRELTLNCPEPISVTDEDKQLINGKEDRGKAAKQETIGGLTQTTNITHKPTVLILESISYFLMFPLNTELPFTHLTEIH